MSHFGHPKVVHAILQALRRGLASACRLHLVRKVHPTALKSTARAAATADGWLQICFFFGVVFAVAS